MVYILVKETETLAVNNDDEVVSFKNYNEAYRSLITEGYIPEKIGELFTFLTSFKPMESIDIDIPEPDEATKEKIDFTMAAKAAIRYLNDYHHPHTTMIVTPRYAEVVEGIKVLPTDEFLKD